MRDRHGIRVVVASVVTLPLVYYFVVLLHECGHGTTAWLLGHKASPFDIVYGGWLLLQADEAVPYDQLLAQGQGTQVALIGISGLTVNVVLLVALGLYRLFHTEVPRFYACAPVRSTAMRRVVLGLAVFFIFLFIYTRGYNPFSDGGASGLSKTIVAVSILFAPLVFVLCDPSRRWVETVVARLHPAADRSA